MADTSRVSIVSALVLLCFNSIGTSAIDWPDATARLRRNFGSNEKGSPTLGHTFLSDGVVRAADAGEVLYVRGKNDTLSGLPSPLGSWIAVDHGDGILGTYARFEGYDMPGPRKSIEKGTVLGNAGKSGWTTENGFYFSLYDRRERRWVNPSLLIPPPPDTRPPTIRSVSLAGKEGGTINPAQARTVRQGVYRVLVDAFDLAGDASSFPLAPYRILCFVNGAEQGALHLETLFVRDGRLMAHRTQPTRADIAYTDQAFDVGETRLSRGRTTLEIIVRDIAGNERSVTYQLTVE